MRRQSVISVEDLARINGGLSLPRLPQQAPQQPENYEFWGPLVERDQSYRPDRDGPAQPEPPVYRWEEQQPQEDELTPVPEQEASVHNDWSGESNEAYGYGDANDPGNSGESGESSGGFEGGDSMEA